MIVNPQLFNYRLIIGSLVIVIIVLSTYSYNNYVTLKSKEAFVKKEKQLVQNELSKMINNYKTINVKNNIVSNKLEGTKNKLNRIIDSIEILPKNASLITHYEAKIKAMNKDNMVNLATLNTFKDEITALNFLLENSTNTKENKTVQHTNEVIIENPIEKLNSSNRIGEKSIPIKGVEKTESPVNIKNIKVQGVKRITAKNRVISTRIASKAKQLQVGFTIAENEIFEEETHHKNIYIQVVDPNNNIVGDKGSVNFGESDLIYSKKMLIHQTNGNIKISTQIKTNKNEPLIVGSYLVNVFHNSNRIANTTVSLK